MNLNLKKSSERNILKQKHISTIKIQMKNSKGLSLDAIGFLDEKDAKLLWDALLSVLKCHRKIQYQAYSEEDKSSWFRTFLDGDNEGQDD